MSHRAAAVLLAFALGSCTVTRESSPPRTATEQLLLSAAADRAADGLALAIPAGDRVFVDASDFEAYDGKYAIGAVKDRLLRRGARLVSSRGEADVVVAVRSGALSIDQERTLVGLPGFGVPVPLAGTLNIPEVALFKKEVEEGVAKLAATGYDARSGSLVDSVGPVFGFSHRIRWVVLLVISWASDDLTGVAAAR
ncbi:MAG: hypothetical protein IRY94_18775 [Rhodospirillaceae bacterium]|nr:hypothetical protein [Rhodospirillaceae bacterium]